jgi:hypothetical protein
MAVGTYPTNDYPMPGGTVPSPAAPPRPPAQMTGWTAVPNGAGGVSLYPPGTTPPAPKAPVAAPTAGVAQKITPAQAPASQTPVMAPPQRVDQAFGAAGIAPPQSSSLPTPSNSTVPSPSQMAAPAASAAPATGAVPSPTGAPTSPGLPPQDQPGALGKYLTPGLRNGLVDALSAMQGVDSGASPLVALSQGFAGAQQSQQSREDRKRALVLADEEARAKAEQRDYDRGRDTREDERKDRGEDRRDREAYFDEIATAANAKETLANTAKLRRDAKRLGLTEEDLDKIEKDTLRYGELMMPEGSFTANDENQAKVEELMKTYRQRRINEVKALGGAEDESGGTSTVPKTGQPSAASTARPGDGKSYATPLSLGTGQTRSGFFQALEAAPPGTFFIHPDIIDPKTGQPQILVK